MLSYAQIENRPRLLRSFTGLNGQAFEQLLSSFKRAYEEWLNEQDKMRVIPRQRARGGGRQAVLADAGDKLLFILFYYKFYPVQEVQGFFFGMGKTQAHQWLYRLTPLVSKALGYELQLPERKAASVEEVLATCPELSFIIDGTERPIERPKDKQKQKNYYSGKKKKHTLKNLVISETKTKKIKVLSPTVEGKQHDKSLADSQAYCYPKGTRLYKDSGFQGYEPKNTRALQPKKKPRGGTLSDKEKEQNTRISKVRIRVEHSIGGAKIYRVVKDTLRHHLEGFADAVMEIACGLHNLRIDTRAFNKASV
jgi:hypothetical protein